MKTIIKKATSQKGPKQGKMQNAVVKHHGRPGRAPQKTRVYFATILFCFRVFFSLFFQPLLTHGS